MQTSLSTKSIFGACAHRLSTSGVSSVHKLRLPAHRATARLFSRAAVVPDFVTTRNFRKEFDSSVPIEKATIPPAVWYNSPDVLQAEKFSVFRNNWICVGRTDQLSTPGDYFTGRLLGEPYIVCMDDERKVRAFYNVCRHHGTRVADEAGHVANFQCPYHGWTYDLQGRLKKATRLKGIKNFKAGDYGLRPIAADKAGPWLFLNFGKPVVDSAKAALSEDTLEQHLSGIAPNGTKVKLESILDQTAYQDLIFIKRISYKIGCNWKVYVDNYLDGGYHVPYAHQALGKRLDLNSYVTTLFDRFSIQSCPASKPSDAELAQSAQEAQQMAITENKEASSVRPPIERVSGDALYTWVYPNFMINRYGPWMDTNLVWPLNEKECIVYFDYFLEPKLLKDDIFIRESLRASDQVQVEDTYLCESVQDGLNSTQFQDGRYAPGVEYPMFHFHQLLHKDLLTVPLAK